ncbi:hypothetical protein HMH01_12290 [Halovulum dunhuangense]|uniref:Regulator of ribonuclease activity B domain-containing protein n=1 Tax=Halovulum dunhuangense TaxID=1505036 RepID=A0A849L4D6_9RHOB|nr:ribonuclease E inhibitor RraB [Halovulum dunhuangense]NNU81216.1 hypothetical protein [Halovulum dunhuangense]
MTEETEPWDFEHQQAETVLTLRELLAETDLTEGMEITLDLQFQPGPEADAEGFLRKLKMFGYRAEQVEDADAPFVEAQVDGVRLSADDIWRHEERTTRLALIHGYTADGWGFLEP